MRGYALHIRTLVFVASVPALVFVLLSLSAAPAHAGGPTLTLEATDRQLRPADTTALSGTLSGVFSGADGKTVTLHASAYPYETEQIAGTTTTDSQGDFAFPGVDPALNTRYRVSFDGDVLDGDASSPTVQIFRFPRADLDLKVTRDGFAEARFDFFYSDQVKPEYYVGREDLHWYFGKKGADRFNRVDRVAFRDTPRGVAGDARFRLPRSRKPYRFFFFPCIEAPAADIGIGNDKPFECPDSINARSKMSVESYAK